MKPSRRKLTTFGRVIKSGATNFVRNLWLAAAAIAVMVVTLGIVLGSIVASETFAHTIAQFTGKIDVSVYLKDGLPDAQRDQLIAGLRKQPNVKRITYISKDDAIKAFRNLPGSNQSTLQALVETGNPLPASLRILPNDPAHLDSLVKYLSQPAVQASLDPNTPVSYSGDRKVAIDKITHATHALQEVGVGAVILFTLISMLIIFNTIQMAIFNRRDELTIMRLLGATTWYIRGPFVVESIIYGVLAALISMGMMWGIFIAASPAYLQASSLGLLDIAYASTYFHQKFFVLLGSQLAAGVAIGAISSVIATRRYLKFRPASGRRRGLRRR